MYDTCIYRINHIIEFTTVNTLAISYIFYIHGVRVYKLLSSDKQSGVLEGSTPPTIPQKKIKKNIDLLLHSTKL